MWLFAILVVLVMGGVAMVAAGRGGAMSDAYDDRPDALVPTGRPLEGADLRRVRFSLAFRGYRMAEVDALLDRLARELEDRPTAPEEPGHETGVTDGPVADDVGPESAARADVVEEATDTPAPQAVRGDDPAR